MPEKIEETLKKLAENTSKDGSTTSKYDPSRTDHLGDPNCPHCKGLGYLRRDYPLGHPQFGKIEICTCREQEIRDRNRSRLFQFSHLDELEHLTFDTFNTDGRTGLGELQKGSLQQAYPDLLDSLRYTFDDKSVSFEDRFDEIKQAPLLILDDFGTQSATDWSKEKLFQILNYRYINNHATVITTNLVLAEIDGRLRSRLEEHGIVRHMVINAPDFRREKDERGQHELSSLKLHEKQTFGTFNFRQKERMAREHIRSLEDAFRLTQTYSEDPTWWIVILGLHGSGKTHLAAAIANYRASQGHQVMFIGVPDLLDHLRATFSPSSTTTYDRLFDEIRNAKLLVLDDLRTKNASPWAREKLIQLLDFRYNSDLPTVITTAEKIDDLEPGILSRIKDGRISSILAISAPAYRGKPNRVPNR
jgi:DNA replication protein DnaC